MSVFRDILKHSSVYGFGLALSRGASVLLLPFYTRFLTPADYGIIALLDVTTAIVNHLAAGGVYGAVMRYHFDPLYKDRQHDLWTTGLTLLGLVALPQLLVVWIFRDAIATAAFGSQVLEGASYLTLAIVALPGRLLTFYCETYLRAEKRSMLLVGITVPGLIFRIAINVYLIGFREMGIYGFLWGNLLGGWLEAAVYVAVLFLRRPFRLVRDMVPPMWSYGWPLILTSLAGLTMHQMNRYMLRWILGDLGPIGTFAVAFQLAQGVNQLVIGPFQGIWAAIMYEIDLLPERRELFQRVFKYYALGIALVLLGVALLSDPIVRILAAPEFGDAAGVLPWLCLAFYLFTLHSLLRVPAMVHQKTIRVARTSVIAAAVNFLANLAFIPRYGIEGAAIASVVTYATFSGLGHLAYRRIENLHFPLRYVAFVCAAGVGLLLLCRRLVGAEAGLATQIAAGSLSWCAAAAGIALGPARSVFHKDSTVRSLIGRIRAGRRG